jgi:hypothetical protein
VDMHSRVTPDKRIDTFKCLQLNCIYSDMYKICSLDL